MAEVWKDVPGFGGTLVACSDGRVARIQGFDYSDYLGLSVPADKGSYPVLTQNLTTTSRGCYILAAHRIIAVTFLGNPPEGCNDVNHLDGDKHNNAVSNLEWSSRKDNLEHARRTGLSKDVLHTCTEDQYRKARDMRAAGEKWAVISEATGMSIGAAWYAVNASPRGRTRPWLNPA